MESLPNFILTMMFNVLSNHMSSLPSRAWSSFSFPKKEAKAYHVTVLHLAGILPLVDRPGFLSLTRKSTCARFFPYLVGSFLYRLQVHASNQGLKGSLFGFYVLRREWEKRGTMAAPLYNCGVKHRSAHQVMQLDVCRTGTEDGEILQNGKTLEGQYIRR